MVSGIGYWCLVFRIQIPNWIPISIVAWIRIQKIYKELKEGKNAATKDRYSN
jgi:hypothetical protein